jgi:hypothetical protein
LAPDPRERQAGQKLSTVAIFRARLAHKTACADHG